MRNVRSALLMLAVLLVVGVGAASAQDQIAIQLAGWSSGDAENAALESMVAAFEEANPDVDVELIIAPEYDTFMQAGFASGEYPNVFYVDSFKLQDWASAEVITPVGDQIEDSAGIYESLNNIFTYDGQLYCPAKDFSTLALFYNVDMFEAVGLEPPTNWEELNAAAAALSTDDVAGLTVGIELPRFLPFLYQAGGAVLDADGNVVFDSPETLAAVEEFVGLFTSGSARSAADLGAGWGGEAFGLGKAAMAIEGNWLIQPMTDQFPDINYGVVELPAGPAGPATMAFTVCYGVADPASNSNQTDAELEASLRLVNFLTGEEGAQMVAAGGFGPMPTRGSAADAWLTARGEAFSAFVAGAEYAQPWSFPPGFSTFVDTFNSALNEAIAGNLDPQDVVTDAAEAAQEAVEELQ